MAKKIRCHCAGKPDCKLCKGEGSYPYEPGNRGYQPFTCPNCEGSRAMVDPNKPDATMTCFTCKGSGKVDPALPPPGGMWDSLCKIFFGA